MRNTTIAQFYWSAGISFPDLANRTVDFFQNTDLHFDRCHGSRADGIFQIWRGTKFEYLDPPWREDPMLEPKFLAAHWSLLESDKTRWAEFAYIWDNNPGSTLENLGTKIFIIRLFFDGLFSSRQMSPDQFEKAVRKYHLLKELVNALACDELMGAHQNCGDVLYAPEYKDPAYPYVDFRFARTGTQVLVRQMEERRMLPEGTPLGRDQDFIYVNEK